MATEWQQLQEMISTLNPKSYVRWLKNRPHLRAWLDEQAAVLHTRSIIETLYCLHYNTTVPLCGCGSPVLFNTFVKGYRKFCSFNCPEKGKAHAEIIKTVWQDEKRLDNMLISRDKTMMDRYGVTNSVFIPGVREKIKETVQERYGADSPLESPIIQGRIKKTNQERYGVDTPLSSPTIRAKAAASFEEKHGKNKMQFARAAWAEQNNGLNPFKIEEINKKRYATMLEKYGVLYPFQLPEFFSKHVGTMFDRYQRNNAAQKHLTDEQYVLLTDANCLKRMLEEHGLSELCEIADLRRELVIDWHEKHGLDIIKTSTRSGYEEEIALYLTGCGLSYKKNCHTTIRPLELDFVLSDNNLAIEFNGLYWHSELAGKKDSKYHLNKMLRCEEQGIRLLSIWEDEWITNSDICKSIISSYCGISTRIAARKCNITVLSASEERNFFNQNHLQGYSPSTKNVALEYEGNIVACMSFVRSRFSKKVEWELLRNASAKFTTVVGGASKLFSHFVSQENPNSIVSYCDRRWFTGSVYSNLGFELTAKNPPTYWYTNYKKRSHRVQYQKHKIKHLVEAGDTKTEWQIQQELGYDRVWDCGQDTWMWKSS